MNRSVSCHLDLSVAGPAELVLGIAVARGVPLASESLTITVAGVPVSATELLDSHGTRLHRLQVDGGPVVVDYAAETNGWADPAPVTELDGLRYLRQSRYCEADTLAPTAVAEFGELTGADRLTAVADWVHQRIAYVSGSSTGTDSALDTLLARQGVCRDFAHLMIALLRALGVPARLAAVYAPGLSPMEFHAVCEALVEGTWLVVDATRLAPRQSLLRVATGRDAADTAFLTSFGADVSIRALEVAAVSTPFELDDQVSLTQLR